MTLSSRQGSCKPHPIWPWTPLQGFSASLNNLCQCLTIFIRENFFLIHDLNLASFTLKQFLLVLSLHSNLKSILQPFFYSLFRHWIFRNILHSNVWKSCVYYLNFLYMDYAWNFLKLIYIGLEIFFWHPAIIKWLQVIGGLLFFTSITLKIAGIPLAMYSHLNLASIQS